jgi:hypothetical protein
MGGQRLARVALVFDAMYCAIVGMLLVAMRARIGGLLQVPGLLVAAVGVATVGYAGVVLGQAMRRDWGRAIKQTMVANAGVSMLLAVAAALHPARGARAFLAFAALDVVSFAVAQGVSLLRRGVRS